MKSKIHKRVQNNSNAVNENRYLIIKWTKNTNGLWLTKL